VKKLKYFMVIFLALSMLAAMALPVAAQGPVEPAVVDEIVPAGESIEIAKQVTTPAIPLVIDIVLLEDETGSFGDDIGNLQGGTTASDIYDTILAEIPTPDAWFGVTGFRDYPISPYGSAGDWVYRELSVLSSVKTNWLNGIAGLTAGGGGDTPEAQYDAIVAAATSASLGWRPGAQHVLVVATDAPFHTPDGTHVNDHASTVAALGDIVVIGLKAPGAGGELDALAAATGGSVQALSSDGSNIAEAILAGLEALTTDVWWEVTYSDPELTVTLAPDVHYGVPGNTMVDFAETIAVADDASQCAPDNVFSAVVTFYANSYPEEGEVIGEQKIIITVPDTTAPIVWCEESVNPHGKKIPPAGSSTMPGPKGGQNEDGFYKLLAEDNCDPNPEIWVSGFGPFYSGDVVKITEDSGAIPESKKMGSDKGQAGAVAAHLILNADPVITAVDASGNVSEPADCLVPPPPK
jgi:hypothetical protein